MQVGVANPQAACETMRIWRYKRRVILDLEEVAGNTTKDLGLEGGKPLPHFLLDNEIIEKRVKILKLA